VVNFTGWQAASPEEKIFRATRTDDGYQIRAKQQLEKGESGQNWPLIILATILGLLAAAIVAAGVAAFMFRKTIITGLLAATLGPRATEITAGMQAATDDSEGRVKSWENLSTETSHGKPEVNKEKATGASQKGQRSRKKPKKEETSVDMEKLTKFMISPQHSMGNGYARRKCDNCLDGKSTRDAEEGVLPTLCMGCETRKGPFVSEQKQQEAWRRAKEMATLLPEELRPRNCARATRKERMYVGYYFPTEYLAKYKDGLGQDEKTGRTEQGTMHDEDFVQIHDVSSPPEKEAVQHGKPY
jgi:hypothetical protein